MLPPEVFLIAGGIFFGWGFRTADGLFGLLWRVFLRFRGGGAITSAAFIAPVIQRHCRFFQCLVSWLAIRNFTFPLASTHLKRHTEPVNEKDRPPPIVAFLVGYRATGKSTLARLLAEGLGVVAIDTDQWIEDQIGISIAECFERDGEERFRNLESEALEAVASRVISGDSLIVATGGGMVIRPEHVDRMRELGVVVWLCATPETIRARLAADPSTVVSRPGLTGGSAVDEVEEVLARRTELYRAAAHHVVNCDPPRTSEEIAEEILGRLSRT